MVSGVVLECVGHRHRHRHGTRRTPTSGRPACGVTSPHRLTGRDLVPPSSRLSEGLRGAQWSCRRSRYRRTASPPPPGVPVSSRRRHSQITVGIAANPSRLCGVRRIFRTGKSPASDGCGRRPYGDIQIFRVRDDDMREHYIAAASETISVPRSAARAVRGSRHNRKRSMAESSGARRLVPYPEQLDQ